MERCADANQIFISLIKIANFRKPKALITCKNCSFVLDEQNDYCHRCGAKVIRHRLTAKHLFQHYTETFFSYDNTYLKTIIYLFKDPKDVIDSYVQGVRKKYMAPLAFFAIAITISGIYLFVLKKYYPEFFDMTESLYVDDVSREIGMKITHYTTEFNSLINFLFIPFLALISRVVFFDNRYNFTEHLVIYFYTMSLFSLCSVVINLVVLGIFFENFLLISGVVYGLFFLYHCRVLKQLFALSIKQMLIKILLFLPLFLVFYVGGSLVLFILVFIFGDYSLQDLVPKP